MKILDNIRIGSIDYSINYVINLYSDEGQRLLGEIDFDNSTILLDNTVQGAQALQVTFLHELVHGMLYSVNSEFTHNETLIDDIAKSLHQVIRDNPGLFLISE